MRINEYAWSLCTRTETERPISLDRSFHILSESNRVLISMPTSREQRVVFRSLIAASIVGLLLAQNSAVPSELRVALAAGISLGWLGFGLFFFIRRFPYIGTACVVVTAVWIGIKYREDVPKRKLVAELKQLGDISVITNGGIWTGDIEYLYFESTVDEAAVLEALQLSRLERLERLVFRRTPITDKTLAMLGESPTLRSIYIEGGRTTDEGVQRLSAALPNCRIEVR